MRRNWMCLAALSLATLSAADWKPLFNGKNLDGWEIIGDGVWLVMSDGTLLGERRPARTEPIPGAETITRKQYNGWRDQQSWLYTNRNDYAEFDLHVEFWTRVMGNSGVSLRDPSRAKCGITAPPDTKCTPSKVGYEIQINNQYPDPHPTGSIYGLVDAKIGAQKDNEWNALDIESRNNVIRVKLNGVVVAEHPGDPKRPKIGPIGLQLHDQFCVIMFRNIRIRELP
ncbi:MAG TPA: DUF1080 domain-containing protein [Bryobacteraceae bacterium]|nr:DUF1080 domain-containing protein [Bryobacteraceae bacterium]